MSDLIHDDYRLLQVISRFGVGLGFGNQSVEAACEASGVDVCTFLAVVNFVLCGSEVNVAELSRDVSVSQLMRYLQRSHAYFLDFRLPAIRRKLIEAINCSAHNQVAFLILKFYDAYAAEVQRHMRYEDEHIHVYVQRLLDGQLPDSDRDYATLVHQHADNHSCVTKSSDELKNIIIKYFPCDADTLRLSDTLMDIYIMEEDLLSHCRLEDTVFAAAVRHLEHEVRVRTVHDTAGSGRAPARRPAATTEELSEREKDVIRLVVQGLSNKEIAERLFISTNTVMTHRRNIARKTQIHSPAGLTIYAIVGGLINLEDVKLL